MFLLYVLGFWPWGIWDLCSLTRDRTRTACIRKQSLNYWNARDVPGVFFFLKKGKETNRKLLWLYSSCRDIACKCGTFLAVMAGEAKETAATVAGVSPVIKFEILAGSELAWEQIPSIVCFHMQSQPFLYSTPTLCLFLDLLPQIWDSFLEKEMLNSPTYFVLDTQHKCQI